MTLHERDVGHACTKITEQRSTGAETSVSSHGSVNVCIMLSKTWPFLSYGFSLQSAKSDKNYRGADKSSARPGRKQARKHVRDARNFNYTETRSVIKFFFLLQGKAPKEINAILTETLACFLPGRARDLSAPLYFNADNTV